MDRGRQAQGFPVLVAVEATRCWDMPATAVATNDGYRRTVEHSVYVPHTGARAGLGITLMEALIAAAKAQGLHVMVAGLTRQMRSRSGCMSAGVHPDGLLPQVGMKFGRWLDLAFLSFNSIRPQRRSNRSAACPAARSTY